MQTFQDVLRRDDERSHLRAGAVAILATVILVTVFVGLSEDVLGIRNAGRSGRAPVSTEFTD